MTVVFALVLLLHFVGLASVLGGFLTQMASPIKKVNAAMRDGAFTQLVTGLALVGIRDMDLVTAVRPNHPNHYIAAAKTLITIIIAVIVVVGMKRKSESKTEWAAVGGLTLVNTLLGIMGTL